MHFAVECKILEFIDSRICREISMYFGLGIVSPKSEICIVFCIFSLHNMLYCAYYYGHPKFYENLTVLLFQLNDVGKCFYDFKLAIHDKLLP